MKSSVTKYHGFKIGDTVRVIEPTNWHHGPSWDEDMNDFIGTETKINRIEYDTWGFCSEVGVEHEEMDDKFWWSEMWFEKVEEEFKEVDDLETILDYLKEANEVNPKESFQSQHRLHAASDFLSRP